MSQDLPSNPPQHAWPLPYEARLDERATTQIDLVVIHCTELPDLAIAREYGERILYDASTGNSGHYYIDRDGSIHAFVRPQRIANHTRGYNPRSIGIELVNTGRYPDWYDSRQQTMREPYPDAQIQALTALLRQLKRELPTLELIAGHEDLDTAKVNASDNPDLQVWRKRDPGPQFPWPRVLRDSGLLRLKP
ncbi:MAG TPA: N-acetylmuramoyl-L-alanine amidase [Arenimonas sp.]|uniref:N-acetylmuramoyl-L-alanine amidase n=1 Tax=Arenimonas sp. TaxID=1872635 RepID=UPI002BB889A1|nr:N-acetylmuramoyl-L-alanine amidase [Arenimonas sp.]HMB55758.1 N-acetylmuramoyl-L-alanine amidase [Arenimonas sp.]